jgi:hypothetical protein
MNDYTILAAAEQLFWIIPTLAVAVVFFLMARKFLLDCIRDSRKRGWRI